MEGIQGSTFGFYRQPQNSGNYYTAYGTLEPSSKQRKILRHLGKKSAKVVTMAKNTKPILETVYGINPSKIEVIHHGVPYRALEKREN